MKIQCALFALVVFASMAAAIPHRINRRAVEELATFESLGPHDFPALNGERSIHLPPGDHRPLYGVRSTVRSIPLPPGDHRPLYGVRSTVRSIPLPPGDHRPLYGVRSTVRSIPLPPGDHRPLYGVRSTVRREPISVFGLSSVQDELPRSAITDLGAVADDGVPTSFEHLTIE